MASRILFIHIVVIINLFILLVLRSNRFNSNRFRISEFDCRLERYRGVVDLFFGVVFLAGDLLIVDFLVGDWWIVDKAFSVSSHSI